MDRLCSMLVRISTPQMMIGHNAKGCLPGLVYIKGGKYAEGQADYRKK